MGGDEFSGVRLFAVRVESTTEITLDRLTDGRGWVPLAARPPVRALAYTSMEIAL